MFGKWNVDIQVGGMPQKTASAFAQLGDMVGAEYVPIAYLGSQQANGVNRAVLAEQTVVAGKDTKNVVVAVFRETKDGAALTGIERVVESGGELGGFVVGIKTEIPEEAKAAFDEAFEGFVGSKVEPFALLATQMAKGMNYAFAAEITPVGPNQVTDAALVVVNSLSKRVFIVGLLGDRKDVSGFGYSFTW